MDHEERIALLLDYENLALGARDHHGGMSFDFRPVAEALAERGRVVVRRAYADWSYFDEDRRMLTRNHVELIEIPQRMGASRKNAADIKMAVDAVELAFERDYIYYDRLEGVEVPASARGRSRAGRPAARPAAGAEQLPPAERPAEPEQPPRTGPGSTAEQLTETEQLNDAEQLQDAGPVRDADSLAVLVAQTVAGLQGSLSDEVTASRLKRTLLRKDPTFSESDHGFRTFGELLSHLAGQRVVELGEGPAKGDPSVSLPETGDREVAFGLLRTVVVEVAGGDGAVALSGLKNQLRRARPDFSEKKLGYRSFLQFCKAAATSGAVDLEWSADADDYLLTAHP
ncbi:NYN domain-containing protein [Micromonospora yangpuensis]|uniref:OST-HTH/LOTUS domain-containing protein n=1 Tax=Micromonospora yangpuensis TaxID=683228 RepID=A0A1C6UUL5_9ACTN|nr:NYN domain-containing protein [Micromonospora yangpuensis]GGM24149.1 hypothetical protein GCM10012279_48130 [Micromonospora yangpuensis]SCL57656.1 OST-HTH/LOTUS domain-containing protein [Micromonospora yangpuensis]